MDLIDRVCIIIQADDVLSVYRTVTEGSGQFNWTQIVEKVTGVC